jgi:PAS domain S-box-containing protein
MMDISERKKAEAELRFSEARFRMLLDNVQDYAIFLLDINARVVRWGVGAVNILGYQESEILGQSGSIIFTPEDLERGADKEELNKAVANGKAEDERWHVRKDGSRFWASGIMTALRDESGYLQGFAKIMRDFTERKQAEEALRESDARLRLALDAAQLGDWDLDLVTKTARRSRLHDQVFGYNFLLPDWSYEIFLNHVHPDDREVVDQKFQRTLVTGEDWEFECRVIWADQSIHWIWSRASIYSDSDGNRIRMLGAVKDITARKQAEAEREQLLAREQEARIEAEAANRMKDEFLATLSHELRTPLNAMAGWTQLLRTRKFDEKTTARALETIDRNTKSLAQLIEDVLDVSRIITGKLRLNMSHVELVPVIEAAIETVQPAADAKHIQIELILQAAAGSVFGDVNRLQQVFWNLLSNAVKFTPKGGRIEIELEMIDSRMQVRVKDTGLGIAPEFLPYVFERFRQADSTTTRSYGGLGLGLAIVRHLVELHGGTVGVESAGAGLGATFIVNLPLRAVRLATSQPKQAKLIGEVPYISIAIA